MTRSPNQPSGVFLSLVIPWLPVLPLMTGFSILLYTYLLLTGSCSQCTLTLSPYLLLFAGLAWMGVGVIGLRGGLWRSSWLAALLTGIHLGILLFYPAPFCLYCFLFFGAEATTALLLTTGASVDLYSVLGATASSLLAFLLVGTVFSYFIVSEMPQVLERSGISKDRLVIYELRRRTSGSGNVPDARKWARDIQKSLVRRMTVRVIPVPWNSNGGKNFRERYDFSEPPAWIVLHNDRVLTVSSRGARPDLLRRIRNKLQSKKDRPGKQSHSSFRDGNNRIGARQRAFTAVVPSHPYLNDDR